MKKWIGIPVLFIGAMGLLVHVENWKWQPRSDVLYDSFEYRHAFESRALSEFVELWSDMDKASMRFARYPSQPSEYVTLVTAMSVQEAESRTLGFVAERGSQLFDSGTNDATGWRYHEFSSPGISGDDSAQMGVGESNGMTHVWLAVYYFERGH